MTTSSVSWEEVCRRRLAAQHLDAPRVAEDLPLYVAALPNRRFDLDTPWLRYHGLADVPPLIDAVGGAPLAPVIAARAEAEAERPATHRGAALTVAVSRPGSGFGAGPRRKDPT